MFQSLIPLAGDHIWSIAVLAGSACTLGAVGWIVMSTYRRLFKNKLLLNTAVNNISQGLTMWDSSERLVLCNMPYIEMYGLSPDIVRPGCTVRQMVEHRIKTGSLAAGEAENYVNLRRESIGQGKTVSHVIDLTNGRTIVVIRRPMPGGGWVATHEDITERRQAEARIAHMAHHDALTDLPNRAMLRKQLDAALLRARSGEHLAVLYLDLDHFKSTNDTLGHSIGDELLKAVAGRLRRCVGETGTIARLGGDEFAILQPAIEHPSDVEILARRIRDEITAPYVLDSHQVIADVSIGISVAPDDGADSDQLLKQADMAMYGAKNDGRGTFCFFEPEMDARMKARRALEFDLRKALANNEFELYYQPLINLESNKVCSCEALLRWHHPERGMVSPAEFIPLAEETGLIAAIGEWVLRTACAEAAKWPDDIAVAINVSPVQFKELNLGLTVVGALTASGIRARRLVIEITETVLMRDNETTLAVLHQLRDLGVKIAMDDFGTGYSSLTYLRSFPFDKIKIDRSFIKDVSRMDDAIIRAITDMASSLSIATTAEGVETQLQLDKIRMLGCTEAQGYLFSQPLSGKDFVRFVRLQAAKKANAA
jgi:diguanylate cyclase (GGDEF)-like protein